MRLLLLALAALAEAAAPRARMAPPRVSVPTLTPAPLIAPTLAAPTLSPLTAPVPTLTPSLAAPVPVLAPLPALAPVPVLAQTPAATVLDAALAVQQAVAAPQAQPDAVLGNFFDGAGKVSVAPVGSGGGVSAQPLSGKALLAQLHEQSGRGYRQHDYDQASDYLFSVVDNVERNGVRGVVDAYSGIFVPGRGKDGDDYPERGDQNHDGHSDKAMNVEHIWPQSFFSKLLPMKSDLHHLMTTFMHPNGIRGHLPFGEVRGQGDYSNDAGAKRGQGVFEPPDAVKGKVARAMLYFYTRYHDRNIYNGAYHDAQFWNDNIEMFLRWNRMFPPDQDERNRNDRIAAWQGNRNPYIDDPSLADRVGVEGFRRPGKLQRMLQRAPDAGVSVSNDHEFHKARRHNKSKHKRRHKRWRR